MNYLSFLASKPILLVEYCYLLLLVEKEWFVSMKHNYMKTFKKILMFLLFINGFQVVFADPITPKRSVSIIADRTGYYPKKLALFAGEKVHLFFTTTNKRTSCFMLDSQSVFLGAKLGEIVESELYFDTPGHFKFYCPQGKIQGEFVVLEPPRKSLQKKQEREVASEKSDRHSKIKIWMPSKE